MRDNEELRKQREERRLEKRARERWKSAAWGERLPDAKRGERNITGGEKPNFETSGKLSEDSNTFRGVVIKYNEPPEARKPKRHWRLYSFKGTTTLPFLPIHRQSAYLLGSDRRVADIPIDHPSCSKQHAVLQYRLVDCKRPDGSMGRHVRPYIIDLNSTNGTLVNNRQIEPQRYVELLNKDVIKFAFSSRDYVLLHDDADSAENDEL